MQEQVQQHVSTSRTHPWHSYLNKSYRLNSRGSGAVVKSVRPVECWVFEIQLRRTRVVKTGSDSSTAKRLALGVSVTGPRRWPLFTDDQCHSRCGTLKNPQCSRAMIAEHRSKFAALHWQWWRFQIRANSLMGRKAPNKQMNKLNVSLIC